MPKTIATICRHCKPARAFASSEKLRLHCTEYHSTFFKVVRHNDSMVVIGTYTVSQVDGHYVCPGCSTAFITKTGCRKHMINKGCFPDDDSSSNCGENRKVAAFDVDATLEELDLMLKTAIDERRRLGDAIMDHDDQDQNADGLRQEWKLLRDRFNILRPQVLAKRSTHPSSSSSINNINNKDDSSDNPSVGHGSVVIDGGLSNQNSTGSTSVESGNTSSSSPESAALTHHCPKTVPVMTSRYNSSFHSLSTNVATVYPWSGRLMAALREIFDLRDFRPNQLAAITATLSGMDVFVLMPTGGGKSLCYQLPATVGNGSKNNPTGVTVVISPLLSLMQDQGTQLINKGVPTMIFRGKMAVEMRHFVLDQLNKQDTIVKLAYMTPEMFCRSEQAQSTLKVMYPAVPLMALTATANTMVQHDIRETL
ncbi:hypothetical protein KVV02_008173, partial [Mortierella alpina]